MAIQTTPDLYSPIFDTMLEAVLEQYPTKKEILFAIEHDDSSEVKKSQMAGFSKWQPVPPGGGIPRESRVQMYDETYVHGEFGDGFSVTFNELKDDEYAIIKHSGNPQTLGQGCIERTEQDCADIFITAQSGQNRGDGVPLASDSHPQSPDVPGTLYDNYLSGPASALSETSWNAMKILIKNNLRSPKGLKVAMPHEAWVVVPYDLEDEALRLFSTRALERPGTAARDINVNARGQEGHINVQVCTWQFLSSATQWFVVFPQMQPLIFIWREEPYYDAWVDRDNRQYNFEGAERHAVGVNPGGWRGFWMAEGA